MNAEKIMVAGEEVTIDMKNLEFNEDTLSDYFVKKADITITSVVNWPEPNAI